MDLIGFEKLRNSPEGPSAALFQIGKFHSRSQSDRKDDNSSVKCGLETLLVGPLPRLDSVGSCGAWRAENRIVCPVC